MQANLTAEATDRAGAQLAEVSAESVPAMSLHVGDVFIGCGDRLLLVTSKPRPFGDYLVFRTTNLETRFWGEQNLRPLYHVTRVLTTA